MAIPIDPQDRTALSCLSATLTLAEDGVEGLELLAIVGVLGRRNRRHPQHLLEARNARRVRMDEVRLARIAFHRVALFQNERKERERMSARTVFFNRCKILCKTNDRYAIAATEFLDCAATATHLQIRRECSAEDDDEEQQAQS